MDPLTPDQAPYLTPNEVATLNGVADASTTVFGTSPSGLALVAAVACVAFWVAQRIDVVSAGRARLTVVGAAVVTVVTVAVAKVQALRLQREIAAWMRTAPGDRWALVIPGETAPSAPSPTAHSSSREQAHA
jgi:hypothetical protein